MAKGYVPILSSTSTAHIHHTNHHPSFLLYNHHPLLVIEHTQMKLPLALAHKKETYLFCYVCQVTSHCKLTTDYL